MVLTDALSCVSDYVSGCLHRSKVVHERGKRNQSKMACYIYFSGQGQMVAKVVANGLSHSFSNDQLRNVYQLTAIMSLITSSGCFAIGGNNPLGLPTQWH